MLHEGRKVLKDWVPIKAMRWTKNFAIPSFAKINLIGIPTGESLMKINWTSETKRIALVPIGIQHILGF